nr:hypothetical protein [Paenibacillus sp. ATY16]
MVQLKSAGAPYLSPLIPFKRKRVSPSG